MAHIILCFTSTFSHIFFGVNYSTRRHTLYKDRIDWYMIRFWLMHVPRYCAMSTKFELTPFLLSHEFNSIGKVGNAFTSLTLGLLQTPTFIPKTVIRFGLWLQSRKRVHCPTNNSSSKPTCASFQVILLMNNSLLRQLPLFFFFFECVFIQETKKI